MLIGIYTDKAINESEKKPPAPPSVNSGPVDPPLPAKTESAPNKGAGALIGKTEEELLKKYGSPVRKDPSPYGYEWWVYKKETAYMLAGVEDGQVVTVYATGEISTLPFKLGKSFNSIFKSRYPETEIIIHANKSYYRFELSEEELNVRPLIPIGNFYAQLYIDQVSGTLSGVRFMTAEVLLKMKPYELVYEGVLPQMHSPGRSAWAHIEQGNEKQMAELTNVLRKRFKVKPLNLSLPLAKAAKAHSKEMFEKRFFNHNSPENGNLEQRLRKSKIPFGKSGENIGANYADAPAAIEDWLNSPEQRKILLDNSFSLFGVGAYRKHYTQIFTGL